MNTDLQSLLPTLILVPVVGFLLYRRTRRTFGKQKLSVRRLQIRIALLAFIAVILTVTARMTESYVYGAVGLVIGIAFGAFGLMHTTMERTAEGTFYETNKWIGLTVTAIFIARLGARMISVWQATHALAPGTRPDADFQRSPLTFGVFLLLAGYYIFFYAGLWRRSRTL